MPVKIRAAGPINAKGADMDPKAFDFNFLELFQIKVTNFKVNVRLLENFVLRKFISAISLSLVNKLNFNELFLLTFL